jgi:Spy/CpxP family protein refolding chaperone
MQRVLLLVLAALVPSLAAQERRPGPPDSARAALLRAEIERRFADRVRQELGLTDDQAAKLRATHQRFGAVRRPLMQRQRDLRLALRDQMRPGVAADPDSVRNLMDGVHAGRAELLRIEQDEDREMAAYLSPVQRARFQMMRQQLLERVQELRRERHGPGREGGEGRRPRRRPGGMSRD